MTAATSTTEGAATAVPSTPEEAARFLREATTPQQARRIYLFCSEQEDDWRAIKLIAFRRYGELLGPVEKQPHTGRGHSVSGTHAISDGDRDFRRRARQVASVPQERFDEYLRAEPVPTRAGLLREHGDTPKKPKPRKAAPTLAGKRQRLARLGRTEAKRNGRPMGFWEIGWDISRLVYAVAGWKVETVDLDEDNIDTMLSVEEDLLYLYDWIDDTISLIHSRLGEDKLRSQIQKLRSKTVENGATVEEAEAASRAADRLQRKINNQLAALSTVA